MGVGYKDYNVKPEGWYPVSIDYNYKPVVSQIDLRFQKYLLSPRSWLLMEKMDDLQDDPI